MKVDTNNPNIRILDAKARKQSEIEKNYKSEMGISGDSTRLGSQGGGMMAITSYQNKGDGWTK